MLSAMRSPGITAWNDLERSPSHTEVGRWLSVMVNTAVSTTSRPRVKVALT